jgi:hypothetical protein
LYSISCIQFQLPYKAPYAIIFTSPFACVTVINTLKYLHLKSCSDFLSINSFELSKRNIEMRKKLFQFLLPYRVLAFRSLSLSLSHSLSLSLNLSLPLSLALSSKHQRTCKSKLKLIKANIAAWNILRAFKIVPWKFTVQGNTTKFFLKTKKKLLAEILKCYDLLLAGATAVLSSIFLYITHMWVVSGAINSIS